MAGQTFSNPLNPIIKNFDLLSINPLVDEIGSLWKKNRLDQNCSLYMDVHVRLIIKDRAGNVRHSKAVKISTKLP